MKVALVTGGTRGIGLGIARCFAAEGFSVAICGRRSEQVVAPVVASLRASGAEVLYVQADVGSESSRSDLIAAVRSELGRLDVLVNNAGIAPRRRADLLEATEASFEEVLRTNLSGPYFLTQACARWMIEQQSEEASWSGCIVNITSISASVASVSRGEYCVSKAGLSMATKLWATRLGEFRIPVFEVRPGIIRTDMTSLVESEYAALIEGGISIERRWGTPEDVGRAVVALATEAIPYSTGHAVYVDGGLTVRRL